MTSDIALQKKRCFLLRFRRLGVMGENFIYFHGSTFCRWDLLGKKAGFVGWEPNLWLCRKSLERSYIQKPEEGQFLAVIYKKISYGHPEAVRASQIIGLVFSFQVYSESEAARAELKVETISRNEIEVPEREA